MAGRVAAKIGFGAFCVFARFLNSNPAIELKSPPGLPL
jgi:hypothetical protein